MIKWVLKKGADRRFRSGHPWVFSNELLGSPKGLPPGAFVELSDNQGNFLARGYGHPNSLIAFREVTRNSKESPEDPQFLEQKLKKMTTFRENLGLSDVSYRLCFGEADGFPGLIIDRYVIAGDPRGQWFVLQAQTAGADALTQSIISVLEKTSHTGIIVKNDSSMRGLEGLAIQPAKVVRGLEGSDPSNLEILIRSAQRAQPLKFKVDLIEGQKTGFFLDQSSNIQLAVQILKDRIEKRDRTQLKILDLCPYVGQWGVQLASLGKNLGFEVETTLFDASADALEKAEFNLNSVGAKSVLIKGDVLHDFEKVTGIFDVVICDPPAFIKSRKDLGPGAHAYFKMNAAAIAKCAPGALFISCSCSGLFTEDLFEETLQKAEKRSGRTVRWIATGVQGVDHPILSSFPEGKYLKCRIGVVD